MRLGVWYRENLPFSLKRYTDEVLNNIDTSDVRVVLCENFADLPDDIDLIWHPVLSGMWPPESELYSRKEPVIATCHGVRHFIIDESDVYNEEQLLQMEQQKLTAIIEWSKFKWRVSRVIAVSHLALNEISSIYNLPKSLCSVIYHGVNHEIYQPKPERRLLKQPYLLCVAQYQYVKNIDRLIEAFKTSDIPEEVRLYLHLPGYNGPIEHDRIDVSNTPLDEETLASLYKNALGFVFPTIHESFGLPVIEAMASGCPVITSKGTGTEEISGGAALLVDPFSITEIREKIEALVLNEKIQNDHRLLGLSQAKKFHWRISANQHLELFHQVIQSWPNNPAPNV